MNIILNEKIRNLGGLGDKVSVKPGFARNYLIPQGKAMQATKKNLEIFEANRASLEKALAEKLKVAQEMAEKLKGLEMVITAHAGDGGRLFGSIGTRDLEAEMSKRGFAIQKHQIHLSEGVIRLLGEYEVMIQLNADLDVPVKVKVISDRVIEA
jgi:large subunit ribosomal protein L9